MLTEEIILTDITRASNSSNEQSEYFKQFKVSARSSLILACEGRIDSSLLPFSRRNWLLQTGKLFHSEAIIFLTTVLKNILNGINIIRTNHFVVTQGEANFF